VNYQRFLLLAILAFFHSSKETKFLLIKRNIGQFPGILSYTIKKNKPALGLLIAVILHTGFNLVAHYAGTP